MARRVFFSFHYKDVWKSAQVRNSWVTKKDREHAGFFDSADWEKVKRNGDAAVKRWIDKQLEGTSVTVVLIGAETAQRPYVRYEIQKSWDRGNGLIGIYVDQMEDPQGKISTRGPDPFKVLKFKNIRTYCWKSDAGYHNLGDWVEQSAKRAANRKS